MRKLLSVVLAAATFAGGVVTAGAADARERGRYYDRYDGRYDGRHYRRHRDNNDGAAVAAGIAGLIIGSALASGGNSRAYYDDRRYYDGPRYGYSYHEPRYRRCRTVTNWDPYYGGYVRQTRCW